MGFEKRIGKNGFGILFLMIVMIVVVTPMFQASARPEYSSELQKVYANGSCIVCHIDRNGGDNLTGYGIKFARQSDHVDYPAAALKAIGMSKETVNVTITENTERVEKKSPGFEMVAVIGIISTIYMLRRNKIK